MKTRCKPGDLAIIVREEPGCEKNIGKIVEVSGPIRPSRMKGPQWLIRSANPKVRWYYKRTSKGAEVYFRRGLRFKDEIDHPDAWLVPIIGKDNSARHRASRSTKQRDKTMPGPVRLPVQPASRPSDEKVEP